MIGNEGEFLFDCSIEGQKDFISFEDKFYFRISEFAGLILPEFEMSFITSNLEIMKLMHEGTLIQARFGRETNSLDNLDLYCTSFVSVDHRDGYTAYNINGFCVNMDFIRSPNLTLFKNMSAIEAVIACASKTFNGQITANITKSNDSQTWYQPNITDKNFISKTLYRADMGASFPAAAITANGKFILKDIIKDLANKPAWRFVSAVNHRSASNEVAYITNAPIASNSGIINAMIGYGYDFLSMVLETEAKITAFIQSKNLLSNTSTIGGSKTSNHKQVIGIQQTENMHENYQKSYTYNLSSLMNLSRYEIPIYIDAIYYAIKPLDTVMFVGKVDSVTGAAHDLASGTQFVTQVVKTIENKHFFTAVKLNRESINGVR